MSALITFIISLGNMVLRGYILAMMWGWFVVTQFPGVSQLGVLSAIGLSLVVGLFNMHSLTFCDSSAIKDASRGELRYYQLHNAASVLVATLATWLAAWLIHLCM
jgi:hypothetical protein